MMQKVVLEGTGRKAILEGYTSAGKTGTAQKVDPATGAYSKTKYIGSFAGFAPLNNPQIVVAVILDSAVGLHQGGQVSAPVFRRVAQQVLEYLHTPHDLPLAPNHQLLLASRAKDKDLEEGTPDHPGEPLETAEVDADSSVARAPSPATAGSDGKVVQAAMRQSEPLSSTADPAGRSHRAAGTGLNRRDGRSTGKAAGDRNRSVRRRARRNRSAVVRGQDRARRRGSGPGCRARTRSRGQRRGPATVSAGGNARGRRSARDRAVRTVAVRSFLFDPPKNRVLR